MQHDAIDLSSFPSSDTVGEESLNRGPSSNVSGTSPSPASPSIGRAAANAHDAVDKAAEAARPAIDRAARYAHETVDRVAGAAIPAADWIGEKTEQVRVTQKQVLDDTCNYISAHPVKSIGMAAALGFLLGSLSR